MFMWSFGPLFLVVWPVLRQELVPRQGVREVGDEHPLFSGLECLGDLGLDRYLHLF